MDLRDEKLNRRLNLEFGGLNIRGSNINSFYDERLQSFLYSSAHRRPADKRKPPLPAKRAGRMGSGRVRKPTEKDFIREQLADTERLLKKQLDPYLIEKLSLWADYLKEKRNSFPGLIRETYPARSVLMAYYYMKRSGIYPVPELALKGLMTKNFYNRLSQKYSKSPNTFKNEWHSISYHFVRLKYPGNIRSAIHILELEYSGQPNIAAAIELARKELQMAENTVVKK